MPKERRAKRVFRMPKAENCDEPITLREVINSGGGVMKQVNIRCENCDSLWDVVYCRICELPHCDKCRATDDEYPVCVRCIVLKVFDKDLRDE
jgi:hypothetical protein